MKKNKTFVTLALLIAVAVLAVGYAAITNIDLTINGTATATASNENFKVKFTNPLNTSVNIEDAVAADYVTAQIEPDTNDLEASFAVQGFDTTNQEATIIYTIVNASPELKASLSTPTVVNNNEEYFSVTATLASNLIAANNATTTLTVKVKLIKTPADDSKAADITIRTTASPVAA